MAVQIKKTEQWKMKVVPQEFMVSYVRCVIWTVSPSYIQMHNFSGYNTNPNGSWPSTLNHVFTD